MSQDAHLDSRKVDEIFELMVQRPPKSFFLFAGAGSGKTRSLVELLRRLTGLEEGSDRGVEFARQLRLRGQAIRVITYTRIAAQEIAIRLGLNPLVDVSTIHSFAWDMIKFYPDDIRRFLVDREEAKIIEEEAKLEAARPGRQVAIENRILARKRRVEMLRQADEFVYSPDQNTYGEGALTHDQVIESFVALLRGENALRRVLVDSYPVVLIDESQDTMSAVLEAFLKIEREDRQRFVLGLFGDFRQRIFPGGIADLPEVIPKDWARPMLVMNHRSRQRIVQLVNDIWDSKLQGRTQTRKDPRQHSRSDKEGGIVRLFIANGTGREKFEAERGFAETMAEATDDLGWKDHVEGYQRLILEHSLAARRLGFGRVWKALSRADPVGSRDAGIAGDGSDAGPSLIRPLMREAAALVSCLEPGGRLNESRVMEVLNRSGRIRWLVQNGHGQAERLKALDAGVRRFLNRSSDEKFTVREAIKILGEFEVLEFPQRLRSLVYAPSIELDSDTTGEIEGEGPFQGESEVEEEETKAWQELLDSSWKELMRYREYLAGKLNYATHQGVKGAEFDRVMVILSDGEADGRMFSFDRVMSDRPLSDSDLRNQREGRETTVDRTLRLLYVACSRPRESLAIVLWSDNPERAARRVEELGWFTKSEVVVA